MTAQWWEDAERFRESRRAELAGEIDYDQPEPSDVLDDEEMDEHLRERARR